MASTKIGDVDFGPAAGFDLEALIVEWFDLLAEGRAERPCSHAPRFACSSWATTPGATSRNGRWLAPCRRRSICTAAGAQIPVTATASLSETDPVRRAGRSLRLRSVESGADRPARRLLARPRRPAGPSNAASDVLVYTTAAAEAADRSHGTDRGRTSGSASSATDTDFTAKLVDVLPDGTARDADRRHPSRALPDRTGRAPAPDARPPRGARRSTSARRATCSAPGTASASRSRAATSPASTGIRTPEATFGRGCRAPPRRADGVP